MSISDSDRAAFEAREWSDDGRCPVCGGTNPDHRQYRLPVGIHLDEVRGIARDLGPPTACPIAEALEKPSTKFATVTVSSLPEHGPPDVTARTVREG
jgi:hypothetical protein